ncbi:hypothetical protein LPB142_10630 [Rhodobacter xanthinilyticus]|uniref:Hedgehog/Intein (Hint) domain-containing protein n=1 Tax=Rhodobacter xanthinilyticus TaxID=1850250 RepID=A0A1D9MCY4_9RHOB|nr:Hint domain-containing protein [Rhodobacter xanthinilyticus]AOZ69716.1 hypothetical protein LPB142_10630 [Rhodobacter xanthinilyticus]
MALYSLQIFSFSAASFSPAWFTPNWNLSDGGWPNVAGAGLTMTAAPAVTALIEDTDLDGSTPSWNPAMTLSAQSLDDDSSHQILMNDITVNGVTYLAADGNVIQDEYEVTLTDGTNTYRFVGISLSPDGGVSSSLIGFAWDGPAPPVGVPLTYVSGSANDYQSVVPCFTPGTEILTPTGPRPIERLRVGDLVTTQGHGAQVLRWIGKRRLSAQVLRAAPELRPIVIAPGALGPGLPARALRVSPQHRMLVRSAIAERMSGTREVLVAAKQLVGLPGITVDTDCTGVVYLHLLFDRHEIVTANGAASESLYTGQQALRAFSRAQRRELLTLFPELLAAPTPPEPARLILSGRLGRRLAQRHLQNARALVEPGANGLRAPPPRVIGAPQG